MDAIKEDIKNFNIYDQERINRYTNPGVYELNQELIYILCFKAGNLENGMNLLQQRIYEMLLECFYERYIYYKECLFPGKINIIKDRLEYLKRLNI